MRRFRRRGTAWEVQYKEGEGSQCKGVRKVRQVKDAKFAKELIEGAKVGWDPGAASLSRREDVEVVEVSVDVAAVDEPGDGLVPMAE